jgi:hypothetical protein
MAMASAAARFRRGEASVGFLSREVERVAAAAVEEEVARVGWDRSCWFL